MSYGNQYQSNPYQQGSGAEQGYGYGQEQHEMQQYGQPAAPVVMSQQDFLAQVSQVRNEMRSLGADVQQIASLHQRALTSSDGSAATQLEQLVAQTQIKNTSIRDQIKSLKADAERTQDGTQPLKIRQFESLNKDFKGEVQRYLQDEQQYKQRYREQIARQYRIANPEATEEDVNRAADEDWGNEGIFQQALRTNRSGQANAVLGNVRARHNELQKIEKSIMELAGLFQDLDTLVVQQNPVIERAEDQVQQTVGHLEKGNVEVDKGIKSALRARKWKWFCLLIVVLIIAIALGVGLGIALNQNKTKQGASNDTGK